MPDRLSPLDVSFLYFEEPTTPMHVGGVAVFQAPGRRASTTTGWSADRRPHRLRPALPPAHPLGAGPPGQPGLGRRRGLRHHLPRAPVGAAAPGTDAQLRELVARVQSRPLDRNRPLWEMYLVEGSRDGRFAIITKTHHAMVDGVGAVDIGQVILDTTPEPARDARRTPGGPAPSRPGSSWSPARSPRRCAGRPARVDTVRGGLSDVRSTVGRLGGAAGGLLAAARTVGAGRARRARSTR